MRLVDDNGDVLGRWNVVDVVVLLVVAALVIAGLSVGGALGGSPSSDATASVTVEATVQPYLVTALAGATGCEAVGAPTVDVVDSWSNETQRIDERLVRVQAEIPVDRRDGRLFAVGQPSDDRDSSRVYVGGPLTLDFCSVQVSGTVVALDAPEGNDV